tara:strand:+ start:110294 stop:111568 length:1275 start_codon:yes stop_codon:yes gene_type:complete
MDTLKTLGIDFGTSNSTCAVSDGTQATLIPLEDGKTTLASAVFFGEEGDVFYGRAAMKAYIEGEEGRLMRGLKSVLGTALMKEKTVINGRAKSFVDILATFIRNLKTQAEAAAGQPIENVVIGRPVHFHENNPEADDESQAILEQIAQSIGFKNIVFQYEPIAAAFAHERRLETEQLSLVIDLGGGTSDFTVIRLSPERYLAQDRSQDILATSGVRVGGTNFDKRLSMTSFMPYLGLNSEFSSEFDKTKLLQVPPRVYDNLSDWPLVHFGQTDKAMRETRTTLRTALEPDKLHRLLKIQQEKLGHAFLQHVERTKIDLTDTLNTTTSINDIGLDFDVQVSRDDFESAIARYIQRIEDSMMECITKAGITAENIDLVILTGGSSELPIINHMVSEKFPNAQISEDNKFGSVGLGLAYNAGQIFKA